jgi:glycerol-3-phosphate dehydrogenase (NAD+)
VHCHSFRGSVVAKIVGNSVLKHPGTFDHEVGLLVTIRCACGCTKKKLKAGSCRTSSTARMKTSSSQYLTRYLPGIKLPQNVVAVPDLVESVWNATMLVFVIPHQVEASYSQVPCGQIQFVESVCSQLKGRLFGSAKAISLIKGMDAAGKNDGNLLLISQLIRNSLDIDVSVLMGANLANEIAMEQFCETTIGYSLKENAAKFKMLFQTDYFKVSMVQDVAGVELCGALKNIVAVAAGIVDGLG